MDLRYIFHILWKRKWFMLLGALVGILLVVLSLYKIYINPSTGKWTYEPRTYTRYQTSIKLLLDAPGFGLGRLGGSPWVWDRTINLANTYSHLITSDIVMSKLKQKLGLIKGSVNAKPVAGAPLIEITVEGTNPREIQDLVQTTAETFITYITREQKANLVPPEERVLISILTSAPAAVPLSSRKMQIAFLMFISPVTAAAASAFVLENLEKSSASRKEKPG